MQNATSLGFPLSPQQKFLWAAQAESGPGAARAVIHIQGPFDRGRFSRALARVLQRHEILRTTYPRSAGLKLPFQVVHPESVPAFSESGPEPLNLERHPALHIQLTALDADRHSVILTLPAISADPVSLHHIVRELAHFYGDDAAPLEDALQYADYSQWHDQCLERDDAEAIAAKNFWARLHEDSVPPPRLPFALPSGSLRSEWQSVPVSIPPSGQPAVLNPGSLLAAWQILLSRLSGQPEVLVGRMSEARNYTEFKDAIGLFAKFLPAAVNLEADLSFAAVAQAARKQAEEAAASEDFFPPENQSNARFGFLAYETGEIPESGGVLFKVTELSSRIHNYEMALECRIAGGEIIASLGYDTVRYSPESAAAIAHRLEILLAAAAASPDTLVSALPIMDAVERERVLEGFNQTTATYPSNKTIHQIFEEQALRTPDRIALRCGEQALTYQELNKKANGLAAALRERGAGPDVPIGLLTERSAGMIVGILGILKSGGCYVPLLPDSPAARLAHQLSETGAPIVVTQGTPSLQGYLGEVLPMEGVAPLASFAATSSPAALAYIIYTSGSTGTPKGVSVSHLGLVNYTSYICRLLGLDLEGGGTPLHFATVSTIAADLGNTAIFPALLSGGCLHVIDYETSLRASAFSAYTSRHPIDVLKITPSHLTALLDGAANILPRRVLFVGGEALPWSLLERVRAAGCRLINHYGPTEATVGCCTFDPAESDVRAWAPATVPIGRPIANTRVYILDPRLEPVPIGVAGELCVAGAGLARGYFRQPEQTAARFVPNPFALLPGDRLYRTGDLARCLPDGNVEFLGRLDQQVKIRGFRVEPAEIVAVLKSHPAVQDAVVIPLKGESGELKLAACAISPSPLKSKELIDFLRLSLPGYMAPEILLIEPVLPLTANGKADLAALARSLSAVQAQPEAARVAPRNAAEETVAAIWRDVLKRDSLSVTDNFFALGGHSLLATQIISRIRGSFRVEFPLIAFLEKPTVAEIAARLGEFPQAESEEEQLARLLREIEGLSEEEAEQLLAAQTPEPPART